MKKQELIHLHGLLAQVQNHYEERTGEDVEHDEYAAVNARPTSIHMSKDDHKEAVFALADGLTTELVEDETEQVPAAAD
ncbi:MAG: UPF0058 family protein [Halorientalis sp.]